MTLVQFFWSVGKYIDIMALLIVKNINLPSCSSKLQIIIISLIRQGFSTVCI